MHSSLSQALLHFIYSKETSEFQMQTRLQEFLRFKLDGKIFLLRVSLNSAYRIGTVVHTDILYNTVLCTQYLLILCVYLTVFVIIASDCHNLCNLSDI